MSLHLLLVDTPYLPALCCPLLHSIICCYKITIFKGHHKYLSVLCGMPVGIFWSHLCAWCNCMPGQQLIIQRYRERINQTWTGVFSFIMNCMCCECGFNQNLLYSFLAFVFLSGYCRDDELIIFFNYLIWSDCSVLGFLLTWDEIKT